MNGFDLKAWRREHMYTQQALSDELGVARQTVVSWEKTDGSLPKILVLALRSLETVRSVAGQRLTSAEYRKLRKRPSEPKFHSDNVDKEGARSFQILVG